ncbi:MAG TPA: dTDP-glucose 4,6-dehydratase [Steroidobacteraceae bacterium]|nr:dTDP-glucose 4,6-dehydratase [Steroidobacteraceae bacterium]
MSFEPRNLCITGGAGFIGANFVRHWLARTREGRVVVLDALTYAGNLENLAGLDRDPRYAFVRGDICDEGAVRALLEQHRIDTLVHFAAESHVDRSILGPDDFIRTNVIGTHSLLKTAKTLWLERKTVPAHRFHHVSTDEVYGSLGPDDAPFHESSPYAPNSPYSASKAASDHLVRAYRETYGLDTTLTNCSNNYGPYQFPEKLIPLTLINILMGKPLPVYGDGLQVRDWLHVADHCEAIALALTRGKSGEVYNIGGNSETTNIHIVRSLCGLADEFLVQHADLRTAYPASPAAAGKQSVDLITHVRDRPGHDRRYAIDYRKAGRELGYSPSRDLFRGLRETLQWYFANRGWWQALLGRDYAAWVEKNYQRE